MQETREFYKSSNGDIWLLVREPANRRVLVRHQPNIPSGGQPTDVEIGDFLGRGLRNPEHEALLHLIGTLID